MDRNRIGITMRVVESNSYSETRDALAQNWIDYLRFALPNIDWIPIPNLGDDVIEFVETWQINGLILSGGNDIGESLLRDTTELLLAKYFITRHKPILGICRGLQLLQTMLGGKLELCDKSIHVGTQHEITIKNDPSGIGWAGKRQVNSFHRYGIRLAALHTSLQALAVTHDHWVEAAKLKDSQVLGLMWHPERETDYHLKDCTLIRWLFNSERRP